MNDLVLKKLGHNLRIIAGGIFIFFSVTYFFVFKNSLQIINITDLFGYSLPILFLGIGIRLLWVGLRGINFSRGKTASIIAILILLNVYVVPYPQFHRIRYLNLLFQNYTLISTLLVGLVSLGLFFLFYIKKDKKDKLSIELFYKFLISVGFVLSIAGVAYLFFEIYQLSFIYKLIWSDYYTLVLPFLVLTSGILLLWCISRKLDSLRKG